MNKSEVFRAWSTILAGRAPSLSIEITKECPLRCPGCYAFDAAHLGNNTLLRQLSDFKGEELVCRIIALLDELRPLHVSLVGGDPFVRYRELEQLIPRIEARGIHTQIVTSAFRVVPAEWRKYKKLNVVVSIDGLQAEHDERRKPATYERILKNIVGAQITIHSTITSQIASRPGYLEEFLRFWSANPAIRKIWFSLFTPQRGATDPEILSPAQRLEVMHELRRLRPMFPKLDMQDIVIDEIANPPASPEECIFARTTETISADLRTQITPCQFGGDPDCSQCGCIASMGLAAVGHFKVAGKLTAGNIFMASDRFGKRFKNCESRYRQKQSSQNNPLHLTFSSSVPRQKGDFKLMDTVFQPELELRRELVRFSRWLSRLGFTPGTAGNLSVRLNDRHLLVTPTGVSKALIKTPDVVIVDLDGRLVAGSRRVTSEICMHLAVYQHRPDVSAVLHAHPPVATGFACSGLALAEPLCQEAIMTLGKVPLARYATTGTDEVAESLLPFLTGHDAILLANHGAISYGTSLLDAFMKMETVEHLAQVEMVAHQLGSPQPLGSSQIEKLQRARAKYLRNAALDAESHGMKSQVMNQRSMEQQAIEPQVEVAL